LNRPDFPADGIMTERVRLCAVTRADAEALLAFQIENRPHLQPWEPLRAPEFFTLPAAEQRLALMEQQMTDGAALHLLLRGRITGAVLGECNFTNIVRGPFQACFLGFSIGGRYEGRGLMSEALSAAIDYVFNEYRLHRIMANHRPENLRSGNLLTKLGFEREGLARAYLKINGEWADHVLTSRINPRV
jgi:[ribosomal protein S5]-alanine N-acetyltransferase